MYLQKAIWAIPFVVAGIAVSTRAVTAQPGRFVVAGQMSIVRSGYTTTLLADGTVLTAGGRGFNGSLASAEIYDPSTGTFVPTGNMITARSRHSATLLNDGRVLVAGGEGLGGVVSRTEIYDPQAGLFQRTGDMSTAEIAQTATLLGNGKVLIVGYHSAFVYDPATGTFAGAGDPGGLYATATLLPDGRVLLVGIGATPYNSGEYGVSVAAIYDPATGKFSQTLKPAHLPEYLYEHTATLLANGKVLIAGGTNDPFDGSYTVGSAELYDPSTGVFNNTGGLKQSRQRHSATMLPSGMVLIAGGRH